MSEIVLREFELSALAFLLSKPIYYAQKRKDLNEIRFSDKKVNRILECLDKSWISYNEFPTKTELKEKLKNQIWEQSGEGLDVVWMEYEDILDEVYSRKTTANTGEQLNVYMADAARKKLANKLLECPIDQIAEVSKQIEGELKSLRRVHYQEMDFGLDFFSKAGLQQVAVDMMSYMDGDCFASGHDLLDQALSGGTRKGELNCVLGSTGAGKSTWLLNLTKGFVSNGCRILHVYLDSLRTEMAVRAGTCFLRREIDHNEDMQAVAAEIGAAYPEFEGKLWFKQYPAREINVDDLNEYVENFKAFLYVYDIERGVPEDQAGYLDGVVLDTIDLLANTGNAEGFMIDEDKATEVNAVAVRHNLFIWTGTQAGTDGMKGGKMKLHMAHGYKSRFHPMANILMLSVPEEEMQALVRHVDVDFGKARRGLKYSSLAFVLDVLTQTFYEDHDRAPKVCGAPEKANAPEQSAEAKGKPVGAKSAEETAHVWS